MHLTGNFWVFSFLSFSCSFAYLFVLGVESYVEQPGYELSTKQRLTFFSITSCFLFNKSNTTDMHTLKYFLQSISNSISFHIKNNFYCYIFESLIYLHLMTYCVTLLNMCKVERNVQPVCVGCTIIQLSNWFHDRSMVLSNLVSLIQLLVMRWRCRSLQL